MKQILETSLNSRIEAYKNAFCFWSPQAFAKKFCSEYMSASFGKHHHQIFNTLLPGDTAKRINILAPRGSGKSTCIAVILPLHAIYFKNCYQKLGIEPYHFILILSRTHAVAESRVRDIKHKIESDKRFTHIKCNGTVKRLLCNNGTQLIVAKGRGAQLRGELFKNHRPDLIISDDLDDPETLKNPTVRAKDQLWFDSDLMQAGKIDRTTNFINIDTLKHPEAIAANLQKRPQWTAHLFRAIEEPADLWHPIHEQQWKQWEQIYTDLSLQDAERITKADAFYNQHLAETAQEPYIKHLWKEQITYYDIRKEICDVGYYPVLREFQNETYDPSQTLFDMKNALKFDIVAEGLLRDDKVLVQWADIAGASIFLDWAGGKDIVDNAYAAVVSVLWTPTPGRNANTQSYLGGTHGYVLDAHLFRDNIEAQIRACFDMHDKVRSIVKSRNYRIRLGIEGFVQDTWDAQKQVAERTFNAERDKRNYSTQFNIEWITRRRNKFDRIDALQAPIRNHWLGFYKELPTEFQKQMELYPTGDFNDGPDALEGACQLRIATYESERKIRRDIARQRQKEFKVRL